MWFTLISFVIKRLSIDVIYTKWQIVYPKANSKMGDYFFNVYGQFVIKKITHSSSGYFVVIAVSFRVLSPLFPTRLNYWLKVETPTLYVAKRIRKDHDILNEKSLYIFRLHTILTWHIWKILSIIFFPPVMYI